MLLGTDDFRGLPEFEDVAMLEALLAAVDEILESTKGFLTYLSRFVHPCYFSTQPDFKDSSLNPF